LKIFVNRLIKDEYAINKLADKISLIKEDIRRNKPKINPFLLQDV